VRVFFTLLIFFGLNGQSYSQEEAIKNKYDNALSLLLVDQEYLKSDSLLGGLEADLKSFDEPDYFVYSVFFRGLSHMKAKNYYKALDFYFKALDLSRLLKDDSANSLLTNVYFGLSEVFFQLGYFELSEYYIASSTEFFNKGGTLIFADGLNSSKQGYLYYLAGDYYNAIPYFDLALDLNKDEVLPHHLEWASAQSVCYAHLENFASSNKALQKAKLESKTRFSSDNTLYSYILSDEAEIKILEGDTIGLRVLLDSILVLNNNDQHVKLNYFLSYINYFQLADKADSTNIYVDLAINHALNKLSFNNYKIAETFLISSKAKHENRNYLDALKYINRAQEILTEKNNIVPNEDRYSSFNARLFLQVLLHKSRVYFALAAKDDFENTSIDILEYLDVFLNQSLGLVDSKYFFLKKLKPQFEQLIFDCIRLGKNELAFKISQKLHGNLLALEIVKNKATNNYELPPGFTDQERTFKIAINEDEIKLSQLDKGTNEFDSISKKLIQSRSELNKFIKSIEDSNPGYYALKYSSPQVKSVSDIQNELLDKHSALVEYFIGENKLYTFIVTHNDLYVQEKEINDEFVNHINNHSDHLRVLLDSRIDYSQYVKSTEYLYSVLLADVFEVVSRKVQQLYIIPDGVISYIPFGSLFDKCPKDALGSRYNNLPFLAKTYNFYYHYSSALFQSDKEDLSDQFVGYAPSFKHYEKSYPLNELVYNKEEVESFGAISSGVVKIDSFATLDKVKESLNNRGILHLATHAESNDSLPLLSRIFLQDGPLHAYEIYNSQTKLDLAVLSACETGDGIMREGEGIMSLARSFLSSGCETIITSLWNVNDRNSIGLLQAFYEYLYDGKSIGNSLSLAKRDYLQNTNSALQAHPFNWATFISIGNPNQTFSKFPLNKLLFAIFLLGVSIFIWKRHRIA